MPNMEDIILRRKGPKDFFDVYYPSEEIGKKIYNSFMKLYVQDEGFPLSNRRNNKKNNIGVISNCMALSTILELESMGVDISGAKDAFRFLLGNVFDAVYKYGYGQRPVFSTEPYYFGNSSETIIEDYVETASKIMIIMIGLRNYANRMDVSGIAFGSQITTSNFTISSYKELAKYSEKLLIDAMHFLTESVIPVKDSEIRKRQIDGKEYKERDGIPVEIKYRGWTYCNPKDDPDAYDTSIYYTYHVTNAYVELYNAYSKLMKDMFSDEKEDEAQTDEPTETEKEINIRNDTFLHENKELINTFRIMTASSGRYIEAILNEKGTDISYDFVRNDFSGISTSSVIDTQDNNAVINTLFILGIYLNSAIDEDYEKAESDKKEWFYNNLQFAISNIKKIYSILETDGKQDLIDTYRLDKAIFKEKSSSKHKDFIKQFRKECEGIAVYDLIPLLCNTYAIVFDYLIRYPQLEMTQNLKLIMDHCGKEEWLWGDDNGFNINNHLYYVVALENFYTYNSTYEIPLSGNEKQYKRIVEKNRNENKKALQAERDINESLRIQNEKLSQKRSALDQEVEKLAKGIFEKQLEEKFEQYIDTSIRDAISYYIDIKRRGLSINQIEDELKKNPHYIRVLALCGTITLNEQLISNGLLDYIRESEGYKDRLEANVAQSIADKLMTKK